LENKFCPLILHIEVFDDREDHDSYQNSKDKGVETGNVRTQSKRTNRPRKMQYMHVEDSEGNYISITMGHKLAQRGCVIFLASKLGQTQKPMGKFC
jgi:hypothetical protein